MAQTNIVHVESPNGLQSLFVQAFWQEQLKEITSEQKRQYEPFEELPNPALEPTLTNMLLARIQLDRRYLRLRIENEWNGCESGMEDVPMEIIPGRVVCPIERVDVLVSWRHEGCGSDVESAESFDFDFHTCVTTRHEISEGLDAPQFLITEPSQMVLLTDVATLSDNALRFRTVIPDDYWLWLVKYHMRNNAPFNPKLHWHLLRFLVVLQDPKFMDVALEETVRIVRSFPRTDRVLGEHSSTHAAIFANLGHWLGMITLQRGIPVPSELNLPRMILEAMYIGSRGATFLMPFLSQLLLISLESSADTESLKSGTFRLLSSVAKMVQVYAKDMPKLGEEFQTLLRAFDVDVIFPELTLRSMYEFDGFMILAEVELQVDGHVKCPIAINLSNELVATIRQHVTRHFEPEFDFDNHLVIARELPRLLIVARTMFVDYIVKHVANLVEISTKYGLIAAHQFVQQRSRSESPEERYNLGIRVAANEAVRHIVQDSKWAKFQSNFYHYFVGGLAKSLEMRLSTGLEPDIIEYLQFDACANSLAERNRDLVSYTITKVSIELSLIAIQDTLKWKRLSEPTESTSPSQDSITLNWCRDPVKRQHFAEQALLQLYRLTNKDVYKRYGSLFFYVQRGIEWITVFRDLNTFDQSHWESFVRQRPLIEKFMDAIPRNTRDPVIKEFRSTFEIVFQFITEMYRIKFQSPCASPASPTSRASPASTSSVPPGFSPVLSVFKQTDSSVVNTPTVTQTPMAFLDNMVRETWTSQEPRTSPLMVDVLKPEHNQNAQQVFTTPMLAVESPELSVVAVEASCEVEEPVMSGEEPFEVAVQDCEEPSVSEAAVQDSEEPSTSEAAVNDGEEPSTSEAAVNDGEESSTSEAAVQGSEEPSVSEAVVNDGEEPSTSEAAVNDGEESSSSRRVEFECTITTGVAKTGPNCIRFKVPGGTVVIELEVDPRLTYDEAVKALTDALM